MGFSQMDIAVGEVVIIIKKSEQPPSADDDCERWSKALKKASKWVKIVFVCPFFEDDSLITAYYLLYAAVSNKHHHTTKRNNSINHSDVSRRCSYHRLL